MIDAILPPFLAKLPTGTYTPCHNRPELFIVSHRNVPARQHATEAKALCQACPIRAACLDHAIRTSETDGIWGGLTPKERSAQQRPDCGTEPGWRSHLARGESCLTCREAHDERLRADRRARLDLEHQEHGGSLAGYRLELLLGLPTCVRCRAVRQEYYAGRPRTGKWYRRSSVAA
ncbi:WhiB family transcriptional regulator [Streptomyces olivaceus]|uniref:WhiB family transcriptional regulator n=1 Tax=Streptomyces olivaceus TaxID=47716 RepID=UPI001CC93956|nr:WhiB family transcriptional regulator [Streptomyces olivaceus]MBZ6085889.1 WhiB family transcriptional regulator [Streptomyces olivaceus]